MSPSRAILSILLATLLPLALPAQSTGELKKAAESAWADQNWAKASDALAKIVEADATNQTAWFRLGYALHAQQKLDEALKCHMKAASLSGNPQIGATATYNAACVFALKKDKDQAFAWLEKAVAGGFTSADQIDGDTDMDNLRDDPRYGKLMERIKKSGTAAPVQVYNYTSKRQSTRVIMMGASGVTGISIDFGAAPWKDEYAGVLEDKKFVNRRWRFGTNFWTNLDTNVPLQIGEQKLTAGYYYLTLEHKGDKKIVINVLDPVEVRKQKIDPFVAHKSVGGVEIALKHETVDDVADALSIKIQLDQGNKSGTLVIRFGPHKLTAPLKIQR